MNPPDPRLPQAKARHQAGALDEAAATYRAILQDRPRDPDALHLLGVVHQQRGDFGGSVNLIGQALVLKPDAAIASNLANALLELGRFEEAAQACRIALSINAAFGMAHTNLGVALRALGQLPEAEAALSAAIVLDPSRPEARTSLGVVLLEMGQRDAAIAVLRDLLAAYPDHPQGHFNLGNALAAAETPAALSQALDHYDKAVAALPAYAEAHANRGGVLRRLDRLEEAEQAYHLTLALNPASALSQYNFGLLLGEFNRPAEAIEAYDRAIALAPDLALAHSHRGNMLIALGHENEAMAAHARAMELAPDDPHLNHNHGLTLAHEARFIEAAAAQRRAIALKPDFTPAYAALAGCLAETEQAPEAILTARKAIALDPDLGMAHSALGQALLEARDMDGALAALERAVELRPSLAQGHLNLGVLHFRRGELDQAEASYAKAMALRSDIWEARYNHGVAQLQRGRYAEGWEGFEARLSGPRRRRQDMGYPQPLWMGEDIAGKTILLHGEQGLGDVLQCARFIPGVARLGAEVIFEAPAALRRLFSGLEGIARFVDLGQPCPPVDCRAPLFSLPHRMGATVDNLPGPIPYLSPPEAVSSLWRGRMDAITARPAPRVGIVWSGNITAKVNHGRSIPLATFEPLARVIGAPLISLQKQYGLDELNSLPPGMGVITLGADYDAGDLADTAAVLQTLDLLIACDTGVAHLAGALGVPVWLAINKVGDWRWMTNRADSPWYPSLRIYRQSKVDDWAGVAKTMAADWARRI